MTKKAKRQDWWRGAIIYQIYPRSFKDTNNDGIGDLSGIIDRLPYIAELGVDGIWICPFYPSPMKDFGYDVSDYRNIDPIFGTVEEFKYLIHQAHGLGIKVIIDLVLSHTSDLHPWFSDPTKKDWYIWSDLKENGSLPNNWVSVFGGPAWTYNKLHNQYYFHNFLKEQPDLNFHNLEVQNEILDICKFWLDMGIDGFRFDVVNFYFHDQLLRDNPERVDSTYATQFEAAVPYSQYYHIYDKSRPENLPFLKRIRKLMDSYIDIFSVGEIGDDYPYELAKTYTKGESYIHSCYNTHIMSGTHKELTADVITTTISNFSNQSNLVKSEQTWPSWAFSNHDVVRAASRWWKEFEHNPDFSKLLIALLECLPGTIFLYQGEELGLPEAKIPPDKIQDPWAKETFPIWQGRDGCRTPIPWDDNKPNYGFSESEPWLPIPKSHHLLSVRAQNKDINSCLNFTRKFTKWRKNVPSLLHGDCDFNSTNNSKIISFTRRWQGNETLCIFNLSDKTQTYKNIKIPAFGFHIDGFL